MGNWKRYIFLCFLKPNYMLLLSTNKKTYNFFVGVKKNHRDEIKTKNLIFIKFILKK